MSANPLTLGCDCLGEIFYFDGIVNDSLGNAGRHPERGLHARGGLRDRLEAHRLPHPGGRGAPVPAAGRVDDLHGRQLRVRLLLVPLHRRVDRVRGQADRRAHHRRLRGRGAQVRRRGRAGHLRAQPPALLQRAHGHGGRRRRTTPSTRSTPSSRTRSSTRTTTPGTPGPRWSSRRRRARATGTGTPTGTGRSPPDKVNELGEKTAYKLEPRGVVKPFVQPGSFIYDRARFVQKPVWVTRYDPREKYAAGDYMAQSPDVAGPARVPGGRRGPGEHRRRPLVHGRHPPHRAP